MTQNDPPFSYTAVHQICGGKPHLSVMSSLRAMLILSPFLLGNGFDFSFLCLLSLGCSPWILDPTFYSSGSEINVGLQLHLGQLCGHSGPMEGVMLGHQIHLGSGSSSAIY